MIGYENGADFVLRISRDILNIKDTLDCGQCFRFYNSAEDEMTGIAFGRRLVVKQTDEEIVFKDTTEAEFNEIWYSYFDFGRDYSAIKEAFSRDDTLKKAISYASGIRILKQDSFEALISFIISQNNNIPRIKGSIEKLCRRFGKEIGDGLYAFPTVEDLKDVKKEDLADLSLGYRDDYIIDCVKKIVSGEVSLDEIRTAEIDEARKILRSIKGIGPKVCECVLLFGFCRAEAFPIDVWIKKALCYFYPDGFPAEFESVKGIAQQYIFHYIRTCGEAIPIEFKK